MSATWLTLGTALIVAVPQFYGHYGEIVAPPVALLVAGVVAVSVPDDRPRRKRALGGAARTGLGVILVIGGASTIAEPLPAPFLHAPHEYANNTRAAHHLIPRHDCVISDSPETALELPKLFAYSVAGDGPTVDPFAAAIDARVESAIAPPSLEGFTRSLSRCRWFATPWFWSAGKRYPGWSRAMQSWFLTHYNRVPDSADMELWYRIHP